MRLAMSTVTIKAATKKAGYEGFLSLELFNEEYWREDPEEVAKPGAESLKRLLEPLR